MYGEWYGICDFVVLSVVEVCVDYGDVYVIYVSLDLCIVYGVDVCVNLCGVVCVVCCLFLTSGCLLCCDVVYWVCGCCDFCLICDACSWRCSLMGTTQHTADHKHTTLRPHRRCERTLQYLALVH